ncbi:MAG TPA: murein biosynthesis integral membrane protein MurJ [Gemmatimonadales bacterium]|nr:murein biosynthesis integral membrane protein MurJ [Gemmatimonadales bacterium]
MPNRGAAGGGGARHAAQVATGIFLTRVLGYVRERVFAYYFGNDSVPADAFRAALRIPNTIRNLLGEGTLSASFIPVYAALNERPDKSTARALAGAVLGLLLLASGVLALLGIGLAPAITTVIAKGFDEPRRQLTITLVRILFPMTGLMVVSAWCLGILNTHRRFFLPYAAPALWNVAGIVAMVAAGTWFANRTLPVDTQLHRLSLALAWGTVGGSVLQIAVQLPTCWRLLRGIPVRFSTAPEGVRNVIVAWLPLLLGAGVAQVSGLIDTFLGSFTGAGGVSALGYAQLVQQLPISLFGVSVTAVSLPELSRDAAGAGSGGRGSTTPNDQLRNRIAVGFRRIVFFVVPSSIACIVLSREIVAALYQTGRFTAQATTLVASVLAAYGVGLVAQSTVKLFASGFYAMRDTRTPVKIAAFSLVISTSLAWVLMRWLGAPGIALGSSIGAFVSTTLHLRDLNGRIGSVLRGADWRAFGATLLAGAAAGGLAFGASHLASGMSPVPRGGLTLVTFGIVYAAATLALKHPDAVRTWQSLTTFRAS